MKREISVILIEIGIVITMFSIGGCAKEKTDYEKEYEQVKRQYGTRELQEESVKLKKEISVLNTDIQTLQAKKESMDNEIQRLQEQLNNSSTDAEIQKLQEQIKQESYSCYQKIEDNQSPDPTLNKENGNWFNRAVDWVDGLTE